MWARNSQNMFGKILIGKHGHGENMVTMTLEIFLMAY